MDVADYVNKFYVYEELENILKDYNTVEEALSKCEIPELIINMALIHKIDSYIIISTISECLFYVSELFTQDKDVVEFYTELTNYMKTKNIKYKLENIQEKILIKEHKIYIYFIIHTLISFQNLLTSDKVFYKEAEKLLNNLQLAIFYSEKENIQDYYKKIVDICRMNLMEKILNQIEKENK